ncbi:diaminopimelate epimerase [Marinilabiliaceae bacterium JC040]|nr:diaminopimelate epimerase [Marinilabiliaceae bacterium JC040]
MNIDIYKYHGAGNDFILIDNRLNNYTLDTKHIAFLCDRHLGVGADGLMILENDAEHDFKMRYYNSDGKEASLCGNGSRCIVRFAKDLNIIENKTSFMAFDGVHEAEIFTNDYVKLQMQDVSYIKDYSDHYFLDTGSPHAIFFVNINDDIDIYNEGKRIRNSDLYRKEGTNVNFVKIFDSYINVATYERGVENETLSCGTGCVASAITFHHQSKSKSNSIDIKAKGGNLNVSFNFENGIYKNIFLEGPTCFVFKTKIQIPDL